MAKYCNCDKFYKVKEFEEGATVKFKELPIKLVKELRLMGDEKFKIKSTLFKVKQTGEVSMVVELDKIPGRYLDPSILIALSTESLESSSPKDDDLTIRNLIKEINTLKAENSYLRSIFNHSLNNNFEE